MHTNIFPLPIPEERNWIPSGELRYLSLEDTMTLPFTNDHQPSKQAGRATSEQPIQGLFRDKVVLMRRGNAQGKGLEALWPLMSLTLLVSLPLLQLLKRWLKGRT